MAKFAVLNGNRVSNIIVADSKTVAEEITNCICIEFGNDDPVGSGDIYDPETEIFTKATE